MPDDKINESKASIKGEKSSVKKDDIAKSMKIDKRFIQVSLSILSGVVGGIAVNIFDGRYSLFYVFVILIIGLIMWGIIVYNGD